MVKKAFSYMLCLIILSTGLALAEGIEVSYASDEDDIAYMQYYVKWDEAKDPIECPITDEEYLANLEKDKNENGILDILEDEDEVHAAAIKTGILGDLNGDERVDNRDVVLMYRHIAGWSQDINSDVLDFNGDGYVTNSDAHHLLKYTSEWPDITLYKGKKHDIIYHLYPEGMFVPEGGVVNVNQGYYYSSEGLTLKNITADGYIFEGWYDGEGESAARIQKIAAGETGEIELYARWTPRTYRIDFDSSLVEVASKYYTIETGATLTNPSLSNYIFVGWTNQDDGRLVRGVPKGSFGHMTLVANWASRRNLAKPVAQLEDPIIAEDSANGKILFVYKLGDIENIPLFELCRFSTAEGISSSYTYTQQTSISTSDAQTISKTIANATTDSATWTLSEGWNDSTTISEESLTQTGRTREEAETIAKSSSNTYRLDTSSGESSVIVDANNYAFKGAASRGGEHETSWEVGAKLGLSVDYGVDAHAGFTVPVKGVPIDIGVGGSFDVGFDGELNGKYGQTTTDTWNNTVEVSGERAKSKTSTKHWNQDSSYSNSSSMSNSHTTSEQISELISDRYGYGQSYSKSGAHSSGQAFTTQNTQQDAYSNTVTYDKSTLHDEEISFTTAGVDGYYRLVWAGTARVFAVVGYDVASCSYFVYTFTVMDDEGHEFLDYSKSTPSFDDCEIGVLPFEIPAFVNDYVNARISRTEGLEININTGKVTGYTGSETVVVIPSYVDIDNGDGTCSSIKVTGIETNAFKNNKTIMGVMFSDFITEIPASAFEGCTSLRDVYIPRLSKIGSRAFYGCTSLSAMTIPEYVTSIGTDAFYNVGEVRITAANRSVAQAAVNSGVKSLVLNIASIDESMANTEFQAPASMNAFELQGGRKSYENMRVKSNAARTTINGVNFVNCVQLPLELHSTNVTLNQTSVSGSGYCMIIAKNNCKLNLFGTNEMNSTGGNAIVCANTTLANADSSVQALLKVNGNIRVWGSITNKDRYLSQTSGSIINITQEEYDQYVNGVYQLRFDANGGSVQETERIAYSGAGIGNLPTATRTGYTLAGWYTAASGGTQVSASSTFFSSGSVTVYAHWTPVDYTVSLNANGGTAGVSSITVSYDGTYANLPVPTRSGYSFAGWYTASSEGSKVESATKVTTASDHTLYAHWSANNYTVTYNGNGGSAGSSSKLVTFGDAYGSLATASRTGYSFAGWYTAASGGTKIESTSTVSTAGNHTLYAHWSVNNYTYSIIYRSSNGRSLGSSSATYAFGTTHTITAPNYSGYVTPGSQNVAWDSTSKTITFTYSPNGVGYTTTSGTVSSSPGITYNVEIQYQNRTSNSVQIRVVWRNTLRRISYTVYQMRFSGSCNGAGIPDTVIVPFNAWSSGVSYERDLTGTSSWVTVGLNTMDQTSVGVHLEMYQYNSQGTNMYNYDGTERAIVDLTVAIPAY